MAKTADTTSQRDADLANPVNPDSLKRQAVLNAPLIAVATATEASDNNIVAFAIVRGLLFEMKDKSASDTPISNDEVCLWSDQIGWIIDRVEEGNTAVREALRLTGWMRAGQSQ